MRRLVRALKHALAGSTGAEICACLCSCHCFHVGKRVSERVLVVVVQTLKYAFAIAFTWESAERVPVVNLTFKILSRPSHDYFDHHSVLGRIQRAATFPRFGLARLAHMHTFHLNKFLVLRFPFWVVPNFFDRNDAALGIVYTEEITAYFYAPAEFITHKMLQRLSGEHRKLVDCYFLLVVSSEFNIGAELYSVHLSLIHVKAKAAARKTKKIQYRSIAHLLSACDFDKNFTACVSRYGQNSVRN